MATLLKDDAGIPIPQYMNTLEAFESLHGESGMLLVKDEQLANVISLLQSISAKLTTIIEHLDTT
jgi:hypothetical protein